MQTAANPVVYVCVSIGDATAGRSGSELFADIVPETAWNFRAFCTS